MRIEDEIDDMCRQLMDSKPKSKRKIRDLKRGIEKAERKRRLEKLKKEGTIII